MFGLTFHELLWVAGLFIIFAAVCVGVLDFLVFGWWRNL